MKLNVIVDERACVVDVPSHMFRDAEEFFQKMDHDMNHGWQMGPEFIENPDKVQRCQIAANKLLTSLSAANETMATLMAGYILKRLPGVTGGRIHTAGEKLHTKLLYEKLANTTPVPAPAASRGPNLGTVEA